MVAQDRRQIAAWSRDSDRLTLDIDRRDARVDEVYEVAGVRVN